MLYQKIIKLAKISFVAVILSTTIIVATQAQRLGAPRPTRYAPDYIQKVIKAGGLPTALSRDELKAVYTVYRLLCEGKKEEALRLIEPIANRYPYERLILINPMPDVGYEHYDDIDPLTLLRICYRRLGNLAMVVNMISKQIQEIDLVMQGYDDYSRKIKNITGTSYEDEVDDPQRARAYFKSHILSNMRWHLLRIREMLLTKSPPQNIKPSVIVNNNKFYTYAMRPIIRGSQQLVLSDGLAEALDLKFKRKLFSLTITLIDKKTGKQLTLKEGEKFAILNKNTKIKLPVAPFKRNGRLIVPLKPVAEIFGYRVEFDKKWKILYINNKELPRRQPTTKPKSTKAPAVTPKYNPRYNE